MFLPSTPASAFFLHQYKASVYMKPALFIFFLLTAVINLAAGNANHSDSSMFYYEKGINAKKEGKNVLAVTYFKKALSFDTSNYTILEELGNAALESRIYYTALDAYNKLLKLKKQSGQTLKQLASIYFSLRRYKDALENALEYEKLEAGADMNYVIGMCLYKIHQYSKAIDRLLKAEKKEPENAVLKYTIAKIYFEEIQSYSKSIEYYEAALKLDGTQTFWEYELGFVCYFEGRVAKAISIWENVEKKGWIESADYGDYYSNIGQAYVDVKNYSKAITSLKKSLEIKPGSVITTVVLGEAYYRSKMYKEAITVFETVLKVDENNIAALQFIGNAYMNIGQKGKAQQYLKRAMELKEK